MGKLSPLERAVLVAIARQVADDADAFDGQQANVQVLARENTGAGFYTTFAVGAGRPLAGTSSPLGDVGATVTGLQHGMGFMLWLKNGWLHQLEGYTYGEDTTGIDFDRAEFSNVGPRG